MISVNFDCASKKVLFELTTKSYNSEKFSFGAE